MFKSIEATGKTIDLAIQAGLDKLQMDRDSVSVEVLEQPRSGFFGIGASLQRSHLPTRSPIPFPRKSPRPPSLSPSLSLSENPRRRKSLSPSVRSAPSLSRSLSPSLWRFPLLLRPAPWRPKSRPS